MTPRFLGAFMALTALGGIAASHPVLADATTDSIASGRVLLAQNDSQSVTMLAAAAAVNPSSYDANVLLAEADLRFHHPSDALKAAQTATRLATAPADRAASSFLLGRAQLQVYMDQRTAIIKKFSGKQADSRDLDNQMSTRAYDAPQGTSPTGSGLGGDASSPDSATYSGIDQVGDATAQDDLHADTQARADAIDSLNRSLGEIEKSFRSTLAASPSYPDAHDGLGLTLAVEGKPKAALTEFQAEVQRDPADIPALAHLAGVQAQQGDTKGAIQSYRRIIKLNVRDQTSYAHLAALYSTQKDSPSEQWAKGMAFLLSASNSPTDAALDYSLAEAAFINVKTPTPAILRGQAMLALAQKNPALALTDITKAIALAPTDADSLVMLGDAQLNGGKPQEALDSYTKAAQSDPTDDAAWYGIGLVQDKLSDPKDAMTAYAKAVAANPDNASALLNLAADQADAKMNTDAVANLREYQRRFPQAGNAADVESFIVQLMSA